MELNQTRIEDAVVQEVADRLIDEDRLRNRVHAAVDQRIANHFETIANAQITAAIEAAIKGGFEHEYCRVNSFGQPQGEPTTIGRELEKMIAGYWNTKVDKHGKPDSSSYGEKLTRAEWIMAQMVATDFSGAMKQHVANLGGTLKDKLRLELHQTVNKLLTEVFHVRTASDENAGGYRGDDHPVPIGLTEVERTLRAWGEKQ